MHNITRLSAWSVPCHELQHGEVSRIQCHVVNPPESGIHRSVPDPVLRAAVLSDEQRPEFVVIPYCAERDPMLARRPRLFFGQRKSGSTGTLQGMLDGESYTAELEVCGSDDPMLQYDLSKIRAVIGTHCRFHGVMITLCGCGICKELRLSLKPEYEFHGEDDYHYVWCQGYVVRPPWVLTQKRRMR